MRNWNSLLPFVIAMREGSFRRAAIVLGISPAAMSQNISQLELQLGVRLFHRTTRRLDPTNEARLLYDRISTAVDTLDESLKSLEASRSEVTGPIRLSLATAFGKKLVLPVLRRFLDRYPLVELELQFDNLSDAMQHHAFDVAIRHGVGSVDHVSRKLRTMKVILIASPGYLEERGHPATIADMLSHDHVVSRGPDGRLLSWKLETREGRPAHAAADVLSKPEPRVKIVGNTDTVIDAVLADLGIAAVCRDYVLDELAAGKLEQVLVGVDVHVAGDQDLIVYLQYPHRSFVPLRNRLLMDFLVEELGGDIGPSPAPANRPSGSTTCTTGE